MTVGYGDMRSHKGRDEEIQSWTEWFCHYVNFYKIDPDEFAYLIHEAHNADKRKYNFVYKRWSAMRKVAEAFAGSGCHA